MSFNIEVLPPSEVEQTVRGNVMAGAEMRTASGRVQEFLEGDAAEGLFTESERLYADIALGLIKERGDKLIDTGERGAMGPAFVDTYRHIRGIMQEERARDPRSVDLKTLGDAHEAGEVASAKLDALLAAAHSGRHLDTAANYIASDAFKAEHPPAEQGSDLFRGMTQDQINTLAAQALSSLFDHK